MATGCDRPCKSMVFHLVVSRVVFISCPPSLHILDIAVWSAIRRTLTRSMFAKAILDFGWLLFIGTNQTCHVQAPGVTNNAARYIAGLEERSYHSSCIYPSSYIYILHPKQTGRQTQADFSDIRNSSESRTIPKYELTIHTNILVMCEKSILIWTCGCTHLQDPRRCSKARFYDKPCDGYAFAWAYRSPISLHTPLRCPSCIRNDEATALKKANEAHLAKSSAYPTLVSVANGDDTHRIKTGRPMYSRTASGTQMLKVPEDWTSEMNRLPGNANEYSAFLNGRFDPLVKLPDTHIPAAPQTPRPSSANGTRMEQGARDMLIAAPKMQRSRSHAPPQCWQGPVMLDETDYPYVEFRGTLSTRPGASRRPSYTGKVLDKGWAPPSSGTLPPQRDMDTAPPSLVPSPQLKVSPPRLRVTPPK